MKTNIYKKDEHIEGYVGEGNDTEKSKVQKGFERGNEGNVVTSFGKETIATKNAQGFDENNITAKDGLDNTGTQGYDSLSDDAYTGAIITAEPNSNDPNKQIPVTIKAQENKGEKLIFDLLINEKLAHVIVFKNGPNFHLNLDGEDIGRFEIAADGKIKRFPQPKGASTNDDAYFGPIEAKLKSLNHLT